MRKKIIFYFLLLCLVATTVFWLGSGFYSVREELDWQKEPVRPYVVENEKEPSPVAEEESSTPSVINPATEIRTVLTVGVPFVAQAPFGDWSNPMYQDACEEASLTLVAYYLSGKTLTPAVAEKELLALADYGEKEFGHYVDTSAEDTAKMFKGYYDISSEVIYDMTVDDIKRALASETLVIVPANGRKLGNPNFTPPGPINHMLVITGYDLETREFVTNDPGTRVGRNYRYDEDILYAAVRDYPTGKHLPNTSVRKAMIVIPKEKPQDYRKN